MYLSARRPIDEVDIQVLHPIVQVAGTAKDQDGISSFFDICRFDQRALGGEPNKVLTFGQADLAINIVAENADPGFVDDPAHFGQPQGVHRAEFPLAGFERPRLFKIKVAAAQIRLRNCRPTVIEFHRYRLRSH